MTPFRIENTILFQEKLKPGLHLKFPQHIPSKFKADYARPYNEFVALMSGTLLPFLSTPLPKSPKHGNGFFKILVSVVAAAIVFAVVPYLGAYMASMLMSAGFAASYPMAAAAISVACNAVAGAALDSAIQVQNTALGLQDHFSAAHALSAGIAVGANTAFLGDLAHASQLSTATLLFQVSKAAVATQLTEMATGLRSHFNAGDVAAQIAATLVASKLDGAITNKLGENMAATVAVNSSHAVTNSLLGSAINHTPIDIQNIAASAIGSSIAQSATDKLKKEPLPGTSGAKSQGSLDGVQRHPGVAARRSRTLSAQDRKFIAETEAVAHMKLDEPGLDVSQQGVAKSGASFWHRSTATASAPKHRTVTAARQLAAQAQKQGGSHQQDLFMENTSQFEAGVIHAADTAMLLSAGVGVVKLGAGLVRTGASALGLFRATATGTMKSQAGEVGVERAGTLANRALNRVRLAQNEIPATNPNAAEALNRKYSALQSAENNAVKTEVLKDGRVRYYAVEKPSLTSGPTRGASYVTEFNPKTGDVSSWIENYDHSGMVNRIHPKMLNGQTLNAPHYPPTMKELLQDSQKLNIQNKYRR